MKDTTLRDMVESALDYEPSIDAANIGVAVDNGVVPLTGHVATYAQKLTAERVVRGVNGVRGIASGASRKRSRFAIVWAKTSRTTRSPAAPSGSSPGT